MATGFALGEVAYLKLEAPSERERDMYVACGSLCWLLSFFRMTMSFSIFC